MIFIIFVCGLYFRATVLTCKKNLSTSDGFPGPGSGTLHQRPLLWQQQVILGFVYEISEKMQENKAVESIFVSSSIFVIINIIYRNLSGVLDADPTKPHPPALLVTFNEWV